MPNPILAKILAKITPAELGPATVGGMRKSSLDALDRLQARGVVSNKVNAVPSPGSGGASAGKRTIHIGDQALASSPDYHAARMGADPLGADRSAMLHEVTHMAPGGYWDSMAEMRAIRGQNMMRNSPTWESFNDDLRKTAMGDWKEIFKARGENPQRINEDAAYNNPLRASREHDDAYTEVLADSGARLGKRYDDALDTGQLPLGDKGWQQELAVSSTLLDRFASARAMVSDFMQRNRAKHIPMQEGVVPPKQGRLF